MTNFPVKATQTNMDKNNSYGMATLNKSFSQNQGVSVFRVCENITIFGVA